MDTHITFINNSNDANNSQVVVFQKNVALGVDDGSHVVWRVIRCAQGASLRFVLPAEGQISVSDSWGNYTPQRAATAGRQFRVEQTPSGATVVDTGRSVARGEVHVVNGLAMGAVNAGIYKDGKLLALKTGVAPRQKAEFRFEPTLWVGQVDQLAEGQVIDASEVDDFVTELSLLGVASADLVMTGGGPGASSTPLTFSLANVVTV